MQVDIDEMGRVRGEKAAWGAIANDPQRKVVLLDLLPASVRQRADLEVDIRQRHRDPKLILQRELQRRNRGRGARPDR